MKRLLICLTLPVSLAIVMDSCRKGEEDPVLSLKSRCARLSGTWGFENSSTSNVLTYSSGGGNSYTSTGTSAEIISETVYDPSYYWTVVETINEYSFSFSKSGTWTSVKDVNWVRTLYGFDYQTTSVASSVTTESGTWSFIGQSNKTYENKERILLVTDLSSYYSTGGTSTTIYDDMSPMQIDEFDADTTIKIFGADENVAVIHLKKLSSKEMIWDFDQTTLSVDGYISPFGEVWVDQSWKREATGVTSWRKVK